MSEIIRVLPMDKKGEFCNSSTKYIQDTFFTKDLPSRYDDFGEGKYCYKKLGMKIEKNTLVLFQYDNMIVALARLNDMVKFDTPQDWYHGAYYFQLESIKVFEPISNHFLNKTLNINIKFSNVKHTIKTNKIEYLINNLKNVRTIDQSVPKYHLRQCRKKECSK